MPVIPVMLPPAVRGWPPGPSLPDRVPAAMTIGIDCVAALAAWLTGVEVVTMRSTLQADQLHCQGGETVHLTAAQRYSMAMVCPSIQPRSRSPCLKPHLTLGVGAEGQVADPRHLWLLLCTHERPGHYDPEKTKELASFHSITSSARASQVGGISRLGALAVLRLMTSSNFVGLGWGEIVQARPLLKNPGPRRQPSATHLRALLHSSPTHPPRTHELCTW